MLATDARAAALRSLVVSGAPPLASDAPGAVGVKAFSNLGSQERQQEIYQALWGELGLHRIQAGLVQAGGTSA